jgi:thiamine kinase-like enzyme
MEEMYPELVEESLEAQYGFLLDHVRVLRDRPILRELSGGLTNRNLLIENSQGKFVARISSNSSSLLAIDREAEYQNSLLAASAGIAARVIDYLPGQGLLVIEYLEGRTFSAADVERNLSRVAESCRQLHGAQRFVRDFNMFEIQKKYLAIVEERGFRLPDNYDNFANALAQTRKALSILDEGAVPCNNDLLPGNFIDSGSTIYIIDYEYSGNNDPCFELGNIWAESFLKLDCLEELVTAYYGRYRPEKVARAWLLALVGKYGWTLWASIQDSVSSLDFDFWSWGMAKYDLAQSEFTSEYFRKALLTVTEK